MSFLLSGEDKLSINGRLKLGLSRDQLHSHSETALFFFPSSFPHCNADEKKHLYSLERGEKQLGLDQAC